MSEEITLQAYKLKADLTMPVYYYEYPKQWTESFKVVSMALKSDKKYLPFKKIAQFLYTWNPNIMYVNDLSNSYRDTTWIISSKPIDTSLIITIFQNCLEITVSKIKSSFAKEHFEEWANNLEDVSEVEVDKKEIPLTTKEGYIHENGLAFEILPRYIYSQLNNNPLILNGEVIRFIPTEKGMLSYPNSLCYQTKTKRVYYSIRLTVTIQTTPHHRVPMLQFKFNITRWMDYKVPLKNWNSANTTVYAAIGNRLARLEIMKNKNEIQWEPLLKTMYETTYINKPLPDVEELIKEPKKFADFFVAHRLEFGKIAVGSGESMRDRYLLNDWISNELTNIIEKYPIPLREKSIIGQNKRASIIQNYQNVDTIHEVLRNSTGVNSIHFKIYYMGAQQELLEKIKRQFKERLGVSEGELQSKHLRITVTYEQQNELLTKLDVTKKMEKQRHEERIYQIQNKLPTVTELTACLILLPYTDDKGVPYYKNLEDPKKAIRAGMATTGRLTQFLDSTNPLEIEQRIEIALLDLIRQLGYVDPFETKKYKNINYNTMVSAMHIINFKRTPYGNTKPTMVYLIRKPNQGPIMVECPALWNGQKYYWEACLAFQEVATINGYLKFNPDRVIGDIKNKLYELSYIKNQPHLLLLIGDGVTRKQWPFLTDKTLSTIKKKEKYTLESIWFEKGKENEKLILQPDNQLRIIRVRVNNEVPHYLNPVKESGDYKSKTGLFSLEHVYYSLAERPNDIAYKNALYKSNSKLLAENVRREFKFSNLVELYPIHLNEEDNPDEWVSLTHNYRNFAHQYKGSYKLPFLLHLASRLEEYIY